MISLIFPIYNEAENLHELYRVFSMNAKAMGKHKFEFIFVDDGSTDQTANILKDLHRQDERVKVIRFVRNAGSHAALAAGLHFCHGECAINMSADLQDPPELIAPLLEHWKNEPKIVWGVRAQREGESVGSLFFSKLYYMLTNNLTDVKTPPLGADIFLVDRAVIEAYKHIPEKHTSIFMALSWLGFPQEHIDYVRKARQKGRSKWTLTKKIKLTIDSLLAFSDKPIKFISGVGLVVTMLGLAYAMYGAYSSFTGDPLTQVSVLIMIVLIIGGIQMLMLGVLGEYLWRTFDESRRRPRYLIQYQLE